MTVSRQIFEIDTDTGVTGVQTLTGPVFSGKVVQFHYAPSALDTGANLDVTLLTDADDTGKGFDIWNLEGIGAAGATKRDTGSPVYGANGRLQVRATPAGKSFEGTLYAWTKD